MAAKKDTAAEQAAAEQAAAEQAAAEQAETGYYIADGKSVIAKCGVLGPGDVITPDMCAGGDADIEWLIAAGHVVKK